MVMGNCEGEQNTWQVAQRSPLAWAALSGCGYRNTWVECLKDSNAQLRKDLSKPLIGFAVRVPPPPPPTPPPFLPNTPRVSSPLRARLSASPFARRALCAAQGSGARLAQSKCTHYVSDEFKQEL